MTKVDSVKHVVGEAAPKIGRFAEVIGPPDCPIMIRWTLFGRGGESPWSPRLKLLIHHFLPNADDRDVHDHPRPFWTLILKGYYDDLKPCTYPGCNGEGFMLPDDWPCPECHGSGVAMRERMSAGMLRFRPASHIHRTRVGPQGCWTLVLMGPLRRRWGFWRFGEWFYWKDYERKFGFGMRCD